MDQRLTDALAFANYRLTLQVHRQNIEARTQAALLVNYQNTSFRVTAEMIAFVGVMTVRKKETLYVDDEQGNTQLIENKNEFLDLISSTYEKAYAIKHQEQQKLKAARNPGKIVGL